LERLVARSMVLFERVAADRTAGENDVVVVVRRLM
jgi:hypothetical protein